MKSIFFMSNKKLINFKIDKNVNKKLIHRLSLRLNNEL